MLESIECATCIYSKAKCDRFCLENPEQQSSVKYWLKLIPRKYSNYYYAHWAPFSRYDTSDKEILPDSLFDI